MTDRRGSRFVLALPLALLTICLALMLLGAGRFSLDWLLRVDERVAGLVRKKGQARVPVLH